MRVHLVDGTYELFRFYYAQPEHLDADGIDVGAVRGVVRSMLDLLAEGRSVDREALDDLHGMKTGEIGRAHV